MPTPATRRNRPATVSPASQRNALVKAIQQVSKAIRKDVQRRTHPSSDSDHSVVLNHLDMAARNLTNAVNEPEDVKRAIRRLIGAAQTLGTAL